MHFTRFKFKTDIGRISYITQHPSILSINPSDTENGTFHVCPCMARREDCHYLRHLRTAKWYGRQTFFSSPSKGLSIVYRKLTGLLTALLYLIYTPVTVVLIPLRTDFTIGPVRFQLIYCTNESLFRVIIPRRQPVGLTNLVYLAQRSPCSGRVPETATINMLNRVTQADNRWQNYRFLEILAPANLLHTTLYGKGRIDLGIINMINPGSECHRCCFGSVTLAE